MVPYAAPSLPWETPIGRSRRRPLPTRSAAPPVAVRDLARLLRATTLNALDPQPPDRRRIRVLHAAGTSRSLVGDRGFVLFLFSSELDFGREFRMYPFSRKQKGARGRPVPKPRPVRLSRSPRRGRSASASPREDPAPAPCPPRYVRCRRPYWFRTIVTPCPAVVPPPPPPRGGPAAPRSVRPVGYDLRATRRPLATSAVHTTPAGVAQSRCPSRSASHGLAMPSFRSARRRSSCPLPVAGRCRVGSSASTARVSDASRRCCPSSRRRPSVCSPPPVDSTTASLVHASLSRRRAYPSFTITSFIETLGRRRTAPHVSRRDPATTTSPSVYCTFGSAVLAPAYSTYEIRDGGSTRRPHRPVVLRGLLIRRPDPRRCRPWPGREGAEQLSIRLIQDFHDPAVPSRPLDVPGTVLSARPGNRAGQRQLRARPLARAPRHYGGHYMTESRATRRPGRGTNHLHDTPASTSDRSSCAGRRG